jgi:hypothetical protein
MKNVNVIGLELLEVQLDLPAGIVGRARGDGPSGRHLKEQTSGEVDDCSWSCPHEICRAGRAISGTRHGKLADPHYRSRTRTSVTDPHTSSH